MQLTKQQQKKTTAKAPQLKSTKEQLILMPHE